MKIVIIDNYDSFTYNLAHLVRELGAEVTVLRNDQFEMSELEPFSKIILSPGPGIPLKQVCCWMLSEPMPLESPFLASAWVIRLSVRFSVPS